jgi:hypothetical protein
MSAAGGRHEEHGMRVWKDGSRFLASVAITTLRDETGEMAGLSEFSHDLSESNNSDTRYQALLDAAPMQAERVFGYHREELLGEKVDHFGGHRGAVDLLMLWPMRWRCGIQLSGRVNE